MIYKGLLTINLSIKTNNCFHYLKIIGYLATKKGILQ
jgi:hypothetical protein